MTEGALEAAGEGVTLRFERQVTAPALATFSALVEPTELEKWLAEAQVDAKAGGVIHLVWPGESEMHGVVQVYDEPSLIEYTWDESDGSSLVRFEVAASSGDTSTLRLIHCGMTKEGAAGFGAGWQSHLEALDVVLAGGSSTPDQRNERYEALHPDYIEAVARL